ncbi:TolC family protein [Echinicola soli]|uniref:TolC family protein n=1 Tax=Echinicola soli TaxID=2591634 RepID=A0A514CJ55_9BACT|nr:TolC family protein [Echinicola soli]QDH79863.1 TolC family protein [Echinicola soli]
MMQKKHLYYLLSLSLLIAIGPLDSLGQSLQDNSYQSDTLRLDRSSCEAYLLQNSVRIVAEELEIDKAMAEKWQAKLWPNPSLEIDEVNLWSTPSQLGYFGEELPPIAGNFGRNLQVSMALEQLVQTAGKRKKLIAIEEVAVEQSEAYFKDFLRELKLSFRELLNQLEYLENNKTLLASQFASLSQLKNAMGKQVELGNTGKAEYVRLMAAQLELKKELFEIEEELISLEHELALLMNLPRGTVLRLEVSDDFPELEKISTISLGQLENEAFKNRPDLKVAMLEEKYQSNMVDYEKAQRIPDVALKVGYDRGGNFMLNFIGFGASIDLPFFDRNQGNIKRAQISQQQAQLKAQYKQSSVLGEVRTAYFSLMKEIEFYRDIDHQYDAELDGLLENYTRNFSDRNISLLAYLDFLEAYLENKEILLDTKRSIRDKLETLHSTIHGEI